MKPHYRLHCAATIEEGRHWWVMVHSNRAAPPVLYSDVWHSPMWALKQAWNRWKDWRTIVKAQALPADVCSTCGGRFGPAFGPKAATCTCGD